MRNLRCFQHVNWEPDREELRKFALAMVLGFLVLGLIAAWKRHGFGGAAIVLPVVGLALGAGALLIGRTVYLAVYLPTSVVGFIVSHVLLTVVFFLVFTPLGLLLRLTGKDLLRLKPPAGTAWLRHAAERPKSSYYRQF